MLTEHKFVSQWSRRWIGPRQRVSHRGTMRRHRKGRSSPIVQLAAWFGLATTSELSTRRGRCPAETVSYGHAGNASVGPQAGRGGWNRERKKGGAIGKRKNRTPNVEHDCRATVPVGIFTKASFSQRRRTIFEN